MHFDGAIGDIQHSPNSLVRQSFGHQAGDLALTLRQGGHRTVRDRHAGSPNPVIKQGLPRRSQFARSQRLVLLLDRAKALRS